MSATLPLTTPLRRRARPVDGVHFDAADVPWPDTADGDYARRYLTPFLRDGARPYVANVDGPVGVVTVGDTALPITLPAPGFQSFVASPLAQYIGYGRDELRHLETRRERVAVGAALHALERLFEATAFERVVMVNSWLLTTNLYPALPPGRLEAILDVVRRAFPGRAVVFRSVDDRTPRVIQPLRDAGARLVFSRRPLYQDPADPAVQKKKQFKTDRKLLRRTPYALLHHDALGPNTYARCAALYRQLYIDKYSPRNPMFTARWVAHVHRERLLEIFAFAEGDRIDAVGGTFSRAGVATPPLFGYDTRLPRRRGLYRLLSAQTAEACRQRGELLNFSAGVSEFKRHRGCLPSLEYHAVFDDHLPAWRRAPWALLQAVCDRWLVPLVVERNL